MPSVRTESQPTAAAKAVASTIPIAAASHHGQPRLMAAALLGVPPEKCLVVEDAAVGLAAGRAAGAHTAALRGLDGDLRIAGLSELIGQVTGGRG